MTFENRTIDLRYSRREVRKKGASCQSLASIFTSIPFTFATVGAALGIAFRALRWTWCSSLPPGSRPRITTTRRLRIGTRLAGVRVGPPYVWIRPSNVRIRLARVGIRLVGARIFAAWAARGRHIAARTDGFRSLWTGTTVGHWSIGIRLI